MKAFKQTLTVVLLMGMLCVVLGACGGGSIVGKWEAERDSSETIEFTSDGTWFWNKLWNYPSGVSGYYAIEKIKGIEGKSFFLYCNGVPFAGAVLKDNSLTIVGIADNDLFKRIK